MKRVELEKVGPGLYQSKEPLHKKGDPLRLTPMPPLAEIGDILAPPVGATEANKKYIDLEQRVLQCRAEGILSEGVEDLLLDEMDDLWDEMTEEERCATNERAAERLTEEDRRFEMSFKKTGDAPVTGKPFTPKTDDEKKKPEPKPKK